MIIKKSDPSSITKTAEILREGGIVIIPTDTVYGFSGIVDLDSRIKSGNDTSQSGNDTSQSDNDISRAPLSLSGLTRQSFSTDARIRAIKGRAETKPLIQLIARPQDLRLYTDDEIPDSLLSKWPGALTIIVRIKKDSPLAASSIPEAGTVAFRCPGDQWLREIIAQCGAPIFSTSVNRSGQPVLDTTQSITKEFEKEVSLIIDDGDKKGSLPSTLVSLQEGQVKILRQGSVKL